MFLDRFFRPRVTLAMGQKLYVGVVAQARTPALYEAYGVPDTVEGRFELYTVHVFLLLDRLRGQGSRASETSQALFDTIWARWMTPCVRWGSAIFRWGRRCASWAKPSMAG